MVVPLIPPPTATRACTPIRAASTFHRKRSATLVFGVGRHVCLGAALARLELEVAVGTLAERFPSMTLIDEAPVLRRNPQMRDMESLRVALRGES